MSKLYSMLKGNQKYQWGCWGTMCNFKRVVRVILIKTMTVKEKEQLEREKPRGCQGHILSKRKDHDKDSQVRRPA